MSQLRKNTYLLDGIPISPIELIKEACHYDEEFKARTFRFTSEAAQILRALGHTVEVNLEIEES